MNDKDLQYTCKYANRIDVDNVDFGDEDVHMVSTVNNSHYLI